MEFAKFPGLRREPEPRSNPADRHPDRLRVLFIGNSFTNYWGGVPLNVTALVKSSPQWWPERPPLFEEVSFGGASFRSHWDARTGAEVLALQGTAGPVAFSPGGQRVLTWSNDGTPRVWDAHTGQK